MKAEPLPNPNVIVDLNDRTIRPESPDGDDYFGLSMGTNGTAAVARRAIAESVAARSTPPGARPTWLRSNGRRPAALNIVPGDRSDAFENPWIPSERDE